VNESPVTIKWQSPLSESGLSVEKENSLTFGEKTFIIL
jgi:hypothetical protein